MGSVSDEPSCRGNHRPPPPRRRPLPYAWGPYSPIRRARSTTRRACVAWALSRARRMGGWHEQRPEINRQDLLNPISQFGPSARIFGAYF